jgi:hypothetical protein
METGLMILGLAPGVALPQPARVCLYCNASCRIDLAA